MCPDDARKVVLILEDALKLVESAAVVTSVRIVERSDAAWAEILFRLRGKSSRTLGWRAPLPSDLGERPEVELLSGVAVALDEWIGLEAARYLERHRADPSEILFVNPSDRT